MNYQTYPPHSGLSAFVKCYWTLEVPADLNAARQRIVPDGCIEMAFILGDNIRRYTTADDFILQPRGLVIGQTIEPFYIEPEGYVNTFAVRFYPYGFAGFVSTPIKSLANTETPLNHLFGEQANTLEQHIIDASGTPERIAIIESFLRERLHDQVTIDNIVRSTVNALLRSKGGRPISDITENDPAKRRNLERKFLKQIGISPKQLGKVIRLQTALKLLIDHQQESLTALAYESNYYDQAHFIKDFREFTGTTPGDFLNDDQMALSTLFYRKN